MATAKHFGAYGAAIGGRDYNSADLSERTLQEVYLPPFYAAARAGAGSFMAAFNDIAGVPTTANRELLRGTLRERWGWQGLLVSDWGAIGELLNHGVAADRKGAALLALDASVDMDMVGGVYADDLKDAIAKDPARLKLLDEAVLRILRVKEQLGLFDNPMQYHDAEREARELLAPGTPRSGARHCAPVHRAAQERGPAAAAGSREAAQRRGDRRAGHRRHVLARFVARAGQGGRRGHRAQGHHGGARRARSRSLPRRAPIRAMPISRALPRRSSSPRPPTSPS